MVVFVFTWIIDVVIDVVIGMSLRRVQWKRKAPGRLCCGQFRKPRTFRRRDLLCRLLRMPGALGFGEEVCWCVKPRSRAHGPTALHLLPPFPNRAVSHSKTTHWFSRLAMVCSPCCENLITRLVSRPPLPLEAMAL